MRKTTNRHAPVLTRTERRGFAFLTFTHIADDLYSGAVPALLPFLALDRHYSYAGLTGIMLGATFQRRDRTRPGHRHAGPVGDPVARHATARAAGRGDGRGSGHPAPLARSGSRHARGRAQARDGRAARGLAWVRPAEQRWSCSGRWRISAWRRWQRMGVLRLGYGLSALVLTLLVAAPDVAVLFIAAFALGIVLFAPFAVQVTLGQDYLPNRIGVASGVTLGLAVSVGGLAIPLFGLVADKRGLTTALAAIVTIPAAACALSFLVHDPRSGAER